MNKKSKETLLLQFIKDYSKQYGYPPTVREMCYSLKVKSTSTIAYYLNKLEKDGSIKKSPNKNRALEITGNNIERYDSMSSDFTRIPILGTITAGEPILAIEHCEEYFMVSPNMFKGEGLFMLTVKGESMINAGICDGDKIIVRQQSTANNGEIIAALIDGMATCKRFYNEGNGHFRLQPENDFMQPIYTDTLEILGKVVGLVRKF